jgi:hypothetical protein
MKPQAIPVDGHDIPSFSRRPVGSITESAGLSESTSTDLGSERHYSVAELANLWNLSENTIRRMFDNEPGVLQWGSQETRRKRAYTTLRIPETVALRVHRRLRIAG